MKCQNCGENEANVRYTQIINGVKKELALCDECSKKLGIQSLDFNIPINFSSFLGDFIDDTEDFLPSFTQSKSIKCDNCGMTYEEFLDKGKFGCSNCYDVFENKIDNVLKNIHGTCNHIGRKYNQTVLEDEKQSMQENEIEQDINSDLDNKHKIEKLKQDLKVAIQKELYEDAARIRDEIKKIENKE